MLSDKPNLFPMFQTAVGRIVLVAAFLMAGQFSCRAAASGAAEEQVRAAFLFQIAQYVYWPEDAFTDSEAPVRMCVLGQDTLVPILASTVRNKHLQNRPVLVNRIAELEDLSACHVVYVGLTHEKQVRDLLAELTRVPVLVVGEAEHFAEWGGTVNLSMRSGRVNFEINVEAGERSRIEFRSQLLRFARIVSERNGGSK